MSDVNVHSVTLEVSDGELVEIAQLLQRMRQDAVVLATSPELTQEERRLVIEESPIDAIKAVRTRLGCSLTAAKSLVDVHRRIP